ncbi:MAG: hypothetical protein QOG43_803 [Actinomycetota bacterium]|nr:hypothetical protein [Actinomycetota bacterium]
MPERTVTPQIRTFFFGLGSAFSGIAGLILFLFPEKTDSLFAWTIARGDTANFLGACFLGISLLSFLSYSVPSWRGVRVAFVGTLTFVTAMALATLLHLDQFNFGSDEPIALAAAWLWTLVYIAAPIASGVLLSRQLQEPGPVPAEEGRTPATPIVPGLRYLFLAQGTLLSVVGVVLFVAPGTADSLWPWPLTALPARAVASFLLGFGVILLGIGRQNEAEILEPPGAACWWLAVLAGMAITRFEHSVDIGTPTGLIFGVVALSLLLGGVAGELAARRLRAPTGPTPPPGPRPRRPPPSG